MFRFKVIELIFAACLLLFAGCIDTANEPEDGAIAPKDTTGASVDTTKGPKNPVDDYLPLNAGNFWEYSLYTNYFAGGNSTTKTGKITLKILSSDQKEYQVETKIDLMVINVEYITDNNIKRDTTYQNFTKTGTIRIDSNRVFFNISREGFGSLSDFSSLYQINRFYPAGLTDTLSIKGATSIYYNAEYRAIKNKGMIRYTDSGGRGIIYGELKLDLLNYSVK
ncbi:MAG: hypothetical protein ACM34K_02365 [Bacillota bacterium]